MRPALPAAVRGGGAQAPGEFYPVAEDENGSYLFSANDLNLLPLLPELTAAGVSSLKIEGRMKTEYYVGTVTAAYRRAIDALDTGEEAFRALLPALSEELACASHRVSDTGFALGAPGASRRRGGLSPGAGVRRAGWYRPARRAERRGCC